MTQAALYAHVSTNNGQNPEMQLRELRAYAARRGWTVGAEYVDQGISGSKERHPQLGTGSWLSVASADSMRLRHDMNFFCRQAWRGLSLEC